MTANRKDSIPVNRCADYLLMRPIRVAENNFNSRISLSECGTGIRPELQRIQKASRSVGPYRRDNAETRLRYQGSYPQV